MNVLQVHSTITGDYSKGETPVLIPNTEVKTYSAEHTYLEASWEYRTLPVSKHAEVIASVFLCLKLRILGIFLIYHAILLHYFKLCVKIITLRSEQ